MGSRPGGHIAGDSGVIVTYTVKPQSATPTTTVPAAHHPLPMTGAPLALELIGSMGLLLAGAVAALAARRRAGHGSRQRG